jgi:dTDP-4-dehydrorhamnose 3,5-epimerase
LKVTPTALPEVMLIEPSVLSDDRGYFFESYHSRRYRDLGIKETFVQDNVSFSRQGVLRGMHFQHPHGQAKLVGVLRGEVFDVAVDVRLGSPTFAHWVGVRLSADNHLQLYVPPGFAHGFVVTSEEALFSYKCTAYYDRAAERTVRWDDPSIGIEWPMRDVTLAERDQSASLLGSISKDELPVFGEEDAR